MALEKALWQRLKNAVQHLLLLGHRVMATRIENMVDDGTPDVEMCLNGVQVWIEMKSCARPVRSTTPIRPEVRQSQSIWHRERVAAGCRTIWVLIQVGDANKARLYLIPGSRYDEVVAPESTLAKLSVIGYNAHVSEVLLRASKGW